MLISICLEYDDFILLVVVEEIELEIDARQNPAEKIHLLISFLLFACF